MDRYYYHGISDYIDERTLDIMLKIMNEGILTRNNVRDTGKEYNHVCLYKNEDGFDYSDPDFFFDSARKGWIDNCFFFIVSPEVEAQKAGFDQTNLVDEWRCYDNIYIDKIVGIALPFDVIDEYRKKFPDVINPSFDEKLKKIIDIATRRGWKIENSNEDGLCDRLDSELSRQKEETKGDSSK